MKILYNIAGTCHSGGMERVLANKANYLVKQGMEVVIVTTDQQGLPPFFSLDERIRCIDLCINYEENNGKSLFNKLLHYPLKQWKHKKRLTKILMQERPDITISMFNNDAGFITDIKDGSKKILEIHFSRFKRLQYNRKGWWRLVDVWRTKQDERIARRFDRFVVLTEEDKENWGDMDNICVIPNASTFQNVQTSSLTVPKVIAIGRYDYQKGFDRLIMAWKKVTEYTTDWHLDIVGDGNKRQELQLWIERMGLDKQISLIKPMSHIDSVYLNSSVLALTSHYEGLPMVLLEAQSFGLPIVAFNCKCGPTDVVTDGVDGFLVPEGDIEVFADRLLMLIQNVSLRKDMGQWAKRASLRYEETSIMKKWMELFHTITK